MVNEEKLRIMTKLAAYEKNVSQREQKEGGYYKSDYIRSHLLVTIWSYSSAFVLVLFLVALYHFDYLMAVVEVWELQGLILAIAAVYILLILGCSFFTIVIYSGRYNQIQKKRREYYNELKKLEAFYKQSREEGNG